MELRREVFGTTPKGEKVFLYKLRNDNGVTVKITNYGGIITSIETPDKTGKTDNIALGFSELEDYVSEEYLAGCPYFGCIAGRYANRIANGKFTLDGQEYKLAVNNGPNHLHGGLTGFDKVLWAPHKIEKPDMVGVELKYRSIHMEEGYPGNLDVTVTYTLNHKNELGIEYKAETDHTTVVNLTNHTYFNLTGNRENILHHSLKLYSDRYTETDATLIPTGKINKVAGTPFDFTEEHELGAKINELKDGYDLNFVLGDDIDKLKKAAVLSEDSSGRTIEVLTTEPGIQLYTGYYIPEMTGSNGKQLGRYAGVALETQHYPDSPNHPDFPSTRLQPGDQFHSKTVYRFGLK
ncbi:aldose epimerase family protein [Prolixibacter sp. NT017]|uniref:aldose epimerase family protein n=1 Tax=Prolixibacter sp. NT017 TaxID=2652390 RepID=UPI0012899415|nr:aldose epimerase family protein [Prolixibacter sp. NT017]GET23788.1 aldose 1-epimerase [Prolixibacter sp. NT017]